MTTVPSAVASFVRPRNGSARKTDMQPVAPSFGNSSTPAKLDILIVPSLLCKSEVTASNIQSCAEHEMKREMVKKSCKSLKAKFATHDLRMLEFPATVRE